jgi:hypothetical protein
LRAVGHFGAFCSSYFLAGEEPEADTATILLPIGLFVKIFNFLLMDTIQDDNNSSTQIRFTVFPFLTLALFVLPMHFQLRKGSQKPIQNPTNQELRRCLMIGRVTDQCTLNWRTLPTAGCVQDPAIKEQREIPTNQQRSKAGTEFSFPWTYDARLTINLNHRGTIYTVAVLNKNSTNEHRYGCSAVQCTRPGERLKT